MRSRNSTRLVGDSNPLRCRAPQRCTEHLGGLITRSFASLTRSILLALIYQHILLKGEEGGGGRRGEEGQDRQRLDGSETLVRLDLPVKLPVIPGWIWGTEGRRRCGGGCVCSCIKNTQQRRPISWLSLQRLGRDIYSLDMWHLAA